MKYENIELNERGARLSALLQDVGGLYGAVRERPAVLVLPGGGYRMLSDREAEPVALCFAKAGFQAYILRYSVSKDGSPIWPQPLEETDAALRLIRAKRDEWHTDPDRIALCGFSAGAHLAACASVLLEEKPAATVLGYPVILPEACDFCLPGLPRPLEAVGPDTPPSFVFMAADDSMIAPQNGLDWAAALVKAQVPCELHMYVRGEHGFTTGEPYLQIAPGCSRLPGWTADAGDFLSDIWGSFTPRGFE